jgi:hypothetical protein
MLIAAALAGCASVPMGDAQQDAAAKTFAVPADKSGIYIYRNESMGGAVTMDVSVDDQPIGQTVAKTFLYKEVAPGRHTVTSKAENTESLDLETRPGKAYFIWQEVKIGFTHARNKLHLVDDAMRAACRPEVLCRRMLPRCAMSWAAFDRRGCQNPSLPKAPRVIACKSSFWARAALARAWPRHWRRSRTTSR